jgi:RNA polymerase sigma-70 factor (ECF subfamily)
MSVDQAGRTAAGQPRVLRQPDGSTGALGDVDLETLFTAYGPSCYGLARSILRDADLAQDVVQEAFLDHWRSASFDATRSTHRRWLLMLTHRKAVDRVRHEQRRTSLPLDAAAFDEESTRRGPEDLALAHVLTPKVRAAVATLPAVQREALALAYWGGYTQREVALITGAPLGTVKTRMRNGMIELRELLQDEHA